MSHIKKIWTLSLALKLLLAAVIPLSADEAYYWVWSHNMQLSYFDHPPMVSWLFWVGHWLEPFLHAVRWPAVILGHCTLVVWYGILKDHIEIERFKYWLYLALFSPLLGFGSLIVTPDIAVVFFWSLSIYFFQRALQEKTPLTYALLGASLGLGFCAKYHIVLFVPCAFVYLFWTKQWREVVWKWISITAVAGLLFCSPVLLWNYLNDFASFTFQLKHGLSRPNYQFSWTWSYLAGQIIALFPLVVWAALKSKASKTTKIFIAFGWGPLLFFFFTSFKALVEANWPIIAYPAVFALALSHPQIRRWTVWTCAFWGSIYIVVISSLFLPNIRTLNEKLDEPFRFQELSSLVNTYQPLYANTYQMASSLWYFSKTPVYKLKGLSRYDFFDTLPEGTPSKNLFYLLKYDGNDLPPWISETEWAVNEIQRFSPNFVLLEIRKK